MVTLRISHFVGVVNLRGNKPFSKECLRKATVKKKGISPYPEALNRFS